MDGIAIRAAGPAGLFYGAQTLRQLLPPEIYGTQRFAKDWTVPCVEIRDLPRYGWRGMQLDVGRHSMPKDDIMQFIDTIASLKFNRLDWHLTDDQGWRIEIKKYPKLTEIGAWRKETIIGHVGPQPWGYDGKPHGGFYTQDELREIVAYAAERHVTIIPEIEMPGHAQAMIAAYPELGSSPEKVEVKTSWGWGDSILNPEESTIEVAKDILTEVMDIFPSEFIHVGGDEAHKQQWEESPRIQELRKQRGLKDMNEMQSWFMKQLNAFLISKGRRLIGWHEITYGGLPDGAAILWWSPMGDRQVAIDTARKGHDVVLATLSYLYFDYYQHHDRKNEPIALGGLTPLKKVYNYDPGFKGLEAEAAKHILGAQGQLWSEYLPNMKQAEYMAFPRACALAEIVWLPEDRKNYADFIDRIMIQEKRFVAAGVNYRKTEPRGEELADSVLGIKMKAITNTESTVFPIKIQGRSAWKTELRSGKSPTYFYCRLHDPAFRDGMQPKAQISITYLDQGTGSIFVEYDSSDVSTHLSGKFKKAASFDINGTGQWKTEVINVTDALFSGGCNGGDLRLVFIDADKDPVVSEVLVEPLP